jgi:hypothetical protein
MRYLTQKFSISELRTPLRRSLCSETEVSSEELCQQVCSLRSTIT